MRLIRSSGPPHRFTGSSSPLMFPRPGPFFLNILLTVPTYLTALFFLLFSRRLPADSPIAQGQRIHLPTSALSSELRGQRSAALREGWARGAEEAPVSPHRTLGYLWLHSRGRILRPRGGARRLSLFFDPRLPSSSLLIIPFLLWFDRDLFCRQMQVTGHLPSQCYASPILDLRGTVPRIFWPHLYLDPCPLYRCSLLSRQRDGVLPVFLDVPCA